MKTIANRDDIWPNRKFIFCQLFCNNGLLVADWINRIETLNEDLRELASMYDGVIYTSRDKQRVGHKTDYRDYYTEPLIELVNNTWGRELSLFGYDFDGITDSSDILYRMISKSQKERIQYNLSKDKLIIPTGIVA